MDKQDISKLQAVINEYGPRMALKGFIRAMRQSADNLSDMRLKERAADMAEMAEVLQKVDDALGE
jgi:hypothetical protein